MISLLHFKNKESTYIGTLYLIIFFKCVIFIILKLIKFTTLCVIIILSSLVYDLNVIEYTDDQNIVESTMLYTNLAL